MRQTSKRIEPQPQPGLVLTLNDFKAGNSGRFLLWPLGHLSSSNSSMSSYVSFLLIEEPPDQMRHLCTSSRLATDQPLGGIEDGLGENVPSGYIVQRAGPDPSIQRPTSGKDRSKDPLMSRSEFVEPSLGRGSELEMGIIVRNTRYQPDYHPALERENDKPQQQAMDQWHRTGW